MRIYLVVLKITWILSILGQCKTQNLYPRDSTLFSHSVVSNSLWPHGLQHARLPCPSPSPRVYSNSCLLSQWCHPTISSSTYCPGTKRTNRVWKESPPHTNLARWDTTTRCLVCYSRCHKVRGFASSQRSPKPPVCSVPTPGQALLIPETHITLPVATCWSGASLSTGYPWSLTCTMANVESMSWGRECGKAGKGSWWQNEELCFTRA